MVSTGCDPKPAAETPCDSSCAPSGPGGRRFKSCLPDQHVSSWIRFRLVWSGSGFFLACAIAAQERFSLRFKGLQASPAHLAQSQGVAGSYSWLKLRNLQMLSPLRRLRVGRPAPPAHHLVAQSEWWNSAPEKCDATQFRATTLRR